MQKYLLVWQLGEGTPEPRMLDTAKRINDCLSGAEKLGIRSAYKIYAVTEIASIDTAEEE